ncbi:MAG TPA: hypothetical protein VNZ44_07400 [Pyrinomonadaceae bacterium]|nr:hypothetical protein [Pyrinomonadaceae bacterium]
MSILDSVAKSLAAAAGGYAVKLWWRWYTFKKDVAKYRQRAVELDGREARQIARGELLRLAEEVAKSRGPYRFLTREMAKQVLRDVIASVRAATHRREPREGPVYFTPGSETEEVWEWTARMNTAALTLDDEDFGMYGGVGLARPRRGREGISHH